MFGVMGASLAALLLDVFRTTSAPSDPPDYRNGPHTSHCWIHCSAALNVEKLSIAAPDFIPRIATKPSPFCAGRTWPSVYEPILPMGKPRNSVTVPDLVLRISVTQAHSLRDGTDATQLAHELIRIPRAPLQGS